MFNLNGWFDIFVNCELDRSFSSTSRLAVFVLCDFDVRFDTIRGVTASEGVMLPEDVFSRSDSTSLRGMPSADAKEFISWACYCENDPLVGVSSY